MGVWFRSWSPDIPRVAHTRAALVLLCAALVSGCGYALSGHGSYLPATIKTVAIPTFENRTPVSRVEQLLTERVRGEFIGRGKYTPRNEEAGADASLRVQI